MLQQDVAQDFVLATGETHSVRSFIELAFQCAGRKVIWEGEGVEEVGKDEATGKILIRIDPKYFRPAEVDILLGDPSKAETELGWTRQCGFEVSNL